MMKFSVKRCSMTGYRSKYVLPEMIIAGRRKIFIILYEYPQSSKSVNSMFEVRSISTCTEPKPFTKVKAEISSVELIAELIEIELQELSLDIVICIKNTTFGIADGYMYPREHLTNHGLVPHGISVMFGNHPILGE